MDRFEDFETEAHRVIQNFIQKSIYQSLDAYAEFRLKIGADRYERTPLRLSMRSILTTRKGEYERLKTFTFGTSRINVSGARGGMKIDYRLFDRYQRRQEKCVCIKRFDNMVILSMLLGLSTRKQRKFFKSFIRMNAYA